MFKLLTIVGARPQIIKAAALSRAVAAWNNGHTENERIIERILHTGQHYDENMSGGFFRELGIPEPDYNLNVGSGTHGYQTARMIEGIENVLLNEAFDGVVVYGDTNSTMAGAIAASKINVPVFHIEAGMRSFNMGMPEEINRIVCDNVSSILFVPTKNSLEFLNRSGFENSKAFFKNGKSQIVRNCGDVMYDNSVYFAKIAEKKSSVMSQYGLVKGEFVLATVHRDVNTDNKKRLNAVFNALVDISERYKRKVVVPLHPRTLKVLDTNIDAEVYSRLKASDYVKLLPPVSFFDIIVLEKNAGLVMTDSGGVQKESFFYETPCVILRSETEWTEIVDSGAGIIADADYDKICAAYESLYGAKVSFPKTFGEGKASFAILSEIIKYLA